MLKSIVAESYHDSPVENKNGTSNTPIVFLSSDAIFYFLPIPSFSACLPGEISLCHVFLFLTVFWPLHGEQCCTFFTIHISMISTNRIFFDAHGKIEPRNLKQATIANVSGRISISIPDQIPTAEIIEKKSSKLSHVKGPDSNAF